MLYISIPSQSQHTEVNESVKRYNSFVKNKILRLLMTDLESFVTPLLFSGPESVIKSTKVGKNILDNYIKVFKANGGGSRLKDRLQQPDV